MAGTLGPRHPTESRIRPLALLLIGVLAVSGAAVFIRMADAPPLVVGAWRLTLASIPVTVLSLLRLNTERQRYEKFPVFLCVLSGLFLALHFAFWISSLQHTSVMKSVVLVTTQPLFVAIASPFLLRERPTWGLVIGIGVASLGAIVMTAVGGPNGKESAQGYAFAVFGAAFAAAYFMIGRRVQSTISLTQYVGTVYPVAAATLVIAALTSGQELFNYSLRTYLMFGLLALVPQIIGHSSLNLALRYLPAAVVTVAVLGEPVGATALAALLLAERPTLQETMGAVIVLLGVWLALRRTGRPVSSPIGGPNCHATTDST